jgi:tRNA(Ile2) C34 agmatinyltransferase TiaS
MSYRVRDETKIEAWRVFFSLSTEKRVMVEAEWKPEEKQKAEIEAARLPEGKISPRYGWKTIKTDYPTCPECGHQGKSTGVREYSYNGGGEHFRCLNPECKHEWCWS